MKPQANSNEPPLDLIASLRELIEAKGLIAEKLQLGLEVEEHRRRVGIKDRHSVPIHDGTKTEFWQAPSLREMFRGNRLPPPDAEMNRYPPEYCRYFYSIEDYALLLCDTIGDQTDQAFEEIYSTLRRRPDGKSLGPAHDFLWQSAALLLGKYVISQAEFESIFGQLARSTRHWTQAPVSRNYVSYLRKTFRGEGV